ncbi:RICIN domain-containing protein [Amycolatopsis sp. NPDC059235]|uniref:RICIN domain-containing protein n=1 Tax=Amycolatopsis sp. NPDC059235 TaxID=3346782 RepID=UPI00366F8AB7
MWPFFGGVGAAGPAAGGWPRPPAASTATSGLSPHTVGPTRLRNDSSGMCLAIWHTSEEGALVFQSPCHAEFSDQYWTYQNDLTLVNKFSGKCLAIRHAVDEDPRTFQASCHPESADQRWFAPGDGTLRNQLSGKCLALRHPDEDGDAAVQASCRPRAAEQRWAVIG